MSAISFSNSSSVGLNSPVTATFRGISASSLSFSSWNFLTSKVWSWSMAPVPCTTGLRIPCRLPSTITSKNRMQMPRQKGRSMPNTSTGSARERDCHTR